MPKIWVLENVNNRNYCLPEKDSQPIYSALPPFNPLSNSKVLLLLLPFLRIKKSRLRGVKKLIREIPKIIVYC